MVNRERQIDTANQLIEEALKEWAGRELIAQGEIVDRLLDIRWVLSEGPTCHME